MKKSTLKKWSARVAATTMVAVGAALMPAAGAQAATPGLFSVCNNGSNFQVQAEFPPAPGDDGGKTAWLTRGNCSIMAPWAWGNQKVVIRARNASGQTYDFAKFSFPSKAGVNVKVRGSYGSIIWARS
ncbi:hypothetical protein [Streptomyces sp. NPDC001340]